MDVRKVFCPQAVPMTYRSNRTFYVHNLQRTLLTKSRWRLDKSWLPQSQAHADLLEGIDNMALACDVTNGSCGVQRDLYVLLLLMAFEKKVNRDKQAAADPCSPFPYTQPIGVATVLQDGVIGGLRSCSIDLQVNRGDYVGGHLTYK